MLTDRDFIYKRDWTEVHERVTPRRGAPVSKQTESAGVRVRTKRRGGRGR